MAKGFIMPLEQVTSLGGSAAFNAGMGALHANGSWMIGDFANNATFPFAFARLPEGPEGRKSMFNGLADSIWVGTEHQEEAWQWVKYAASKECADIVGELRRRLPGPAVRRRQGPGCLRGQGAGCLRLHRCRPPKPDGTFLFPVTDNASEITAIMNPAHAEHHARPGHRSGCDSRPPRKKSTPCSSKLNR